MMTVHVVSYNLLVPKLAEEPGFYYMCDPRFLNSEYRWNLIQSMLKQEIVNNKNTIICLQELSRAMLPKIKLFFRQFNYTLFDKLYGQQHNDYMGVGIAIPASMKLMTVSFINIGDQIRLRLHDKQLNIFDRINKLWKDFVNKNGQKGSDPWEIAMTKANELVLVHIVVDRTPFCIGTYHMPCLFKMPDVMMIHASMVKDIMLELAAGKNVILAGDFNTKPSDEYYRVITERGFARGRLPESRNYAITYRPNADQMLKSAYREKNGIEPAFTNFAATSNEPPFRATLDYIFFDGRLTVEKVLRLPNRPKGESYPDETHPSDHLMIAASFRFF
jgi:mRNA deadenylase 3'-5' endonuclease subunit Ccr4